MPSYQHDTPKKSLKQTRTEETRREMTRRRHEFSNSIRKQKKSQLLQLKRKCTSTAKTPTTTSLKDTALHYLHQPNLSTLQALETALATTDNNNNTSTTTSLLDLDTPTQMLELCNTLAKSLHANASLQERLSASRVFTNLAAMNSSKDAESISYYQQQPQGWCAVLMESHVLPVVADSLQTFAIQVDAATTSRDAPLLQVCQQMLWAVGNVAGDSQMARDALRRAKIIPSLCTVLKQGMQLKHTSICRNAAWALSNLTRGVTTSGTEFCGESLLTPALLASVLSSPEQFVSATIQSTWWQTVAKEACWILAFLSAREDAVVDYLCHHSASSDPVLSLSSNTQSVVVAALAHRLDEASKAVVSNHARELTETQLQALRMTIPCLRAIGNIAIASQGRHVGILLQESSILTSLVTLIQAGYSLPNGDIEAVAVEATWAAGTLLCDAGIESHFSTTLAAPTLLPTLQQAILHGKLDFKREATCAVWNAVAAPPNAREDALQSLATRNEFLSTTARVPGIMTCLVKMLTSMDADAVFYSIQLINAMLRRLLDTNVKREFIESHGVEALEAVCDTASQRHAHGSGQEQWNNDMSDDASADIAADLIDDLFSQTALDFNPDEHDNEGMTMQMPASFTFSPISMDAQQEHFNFGGQQQSQSSVVPVMVPDASMNDVAISGRGRGKPVPAWMNPQS